VEEEWVNEGKEHEAMSGTQKIGNFVKRYNFFVISLASSFGCSSILTAILCKQSETGGGNLAFGQQKKWYSSESKEQIRMRGPEVQNERGSKRS
jgi:hypothetical protein